MGFPKEGPGGSYMLWASPRQDRGVLHTAGFPKVGPGGLTHCRLLQGGTGGSYTLQASTRWDWRVLYTVGFPKAGPGGGLHTAGFPKVGPGGSYRLWASPRRDLGVSRVLSGPSGSEKPRPLGCTSMASKLHSVFCVGPSRNEKVKF